MTSLSILSAEHRFEAVSQRVFLTCEGSSVLSVQRRFVAVSQRVLLLFTGEGSFVLSVEGQFVAVSQRVLLAGEGSHRTSHCSSEPTCFIDWRRVLCPLRPTPLCSSEPTCFIIIYW